MIVSHHSRLFKYQSMVFLIPSANFVSGSQPSSLWIFVMSLPVCYVGDQAFRFAEFAADEFYDIDVAHFIVSADVVDFADTSFVDDQIDRAAVILNVQPVAHVFSFSVDRKRFVV